jgi:hypothetical protein
MYSLYDPTPVVNSPQGERLVSQLVQKEQSGQAYPLSCLMAAIRSQVKGEKVKILRFALHRRIQWTLGEQRRALRVLQGLNQGV